MNYASLNLFTDRYVRNARGKSMHLGVDSQRWSRRKVLKPFPWYQGQEMREDGLFVHHERQLITEPADIMILKAHSKLAREWRKIPHIRKIVMVNGNPVLRFERIP